GDSVRHRALPRANVGSCPQVADRPIDSLPQAEGPRLRRRGARQRPGDRCGRVTGPGNSSARRSRNLAFVGELGSGFDRPCWARSLRRACVCRCVTGSGSRSMCSHGIDRLLTSTAIALALTLGSGAFALADDSTRAIEALVPVPQPADVPPPSIADIGGPATGSVSAQPADTKAAGPAVANAAPSVDALVPMPEPANVPPPSKKDIGKTIAAADQPIAEKVRDLFAGRSDRIIDRKKERQDAERFYAARDFAPIWIENGAVNARANAVIA